MIMIKIQLRGYDSFAPAERHVGLPKHSIFSNLGLTHFCREQRSLFPTVSLMGASAVVARFIGRGEACGATTNRRATRL